MNTFIIAEIGVNHNGDLKLALELVEVAAKAGAQAAKFQTFKADSITVKNTDTVAYQKREAGAEDQHAMLRKLELSDEEHGVIADHCASLGIEFMSTAFDEASLDLLCRLGIRRIKVPSGEVTNDPYLADCAKRGLPIVLSTGMANLDEVRHAVEVIEGIWASTGKTPGGPAPLTVLHCTSAYPTDFADANLRAMGTMATALDRPIGYSDHTQGIFVAPMAVALGATMIEKHITLDRTMSGPDHSASIEPDELVRMIQAISDVELLLGDGLKAPRESEMEARRLVRRGLKAARDLPVGTRLSLEDIAILRPATGLAPAELATAVGKTLLQSLKTGDPILAPHLA